MACEKSFTDEAKFITPLGFTDYPPYLCDPDDLSGFEGISLGMMTSLLISQYQNSPILIEYISAFIAEIDTVMTEVQRVHYGQLLANASGEQLDVIGRILDQTRNMNLPKEFFGFVGAVDVKKMADEATPADGGVFKSESESGFDLVPLSDSEYRRALLAKAFVLNVDVFDVNTIFKVIHIILGRVPSTMYFEEVDADNWVLHLSSTNFSTTDIAILRELKSTYIPMTVTYTLVLD